LAALGAIAALVARIRVEVVREVVDTDASQDAPPPRSTGTQKVKIQLDDGDE